MSKLGYWFYGHLVPNKVAADGCYNIRDSFIKTLVSIDDNKILSLGNIRDKEEDVKL